MTVRQIILKSVYPLLILLGKGKGRKRILSNHKNLGSMKPFYELHVQLNTNATLPFSSLKGKKILLVNTASDCGYTPQYSELQKLYEQQKDHLLIIGFPANDFKEQEKGNDEEIARFCQVNYGVTFPLAKKSTVVKGPGQHPVYQWLSQKDLNGWNDQEPVWNFSKYLINEKGELTHFFEPSVSPLDPVVTDAINR